MPFVRTIPKPDSEFVLNSLTRMGGWVVESATEDPESFVVVSSACAVLCILWLIIVTLRQTIVGIGAAASEIAADVFSREGLQQLGLSSSPGTVTLMTSGSTGSGAEERAAEQTPRSAAE